MARHWRETQHKDKYLQAAREAGYRSRAAFKLQQIQTRYQLFKPGMCVLDIGAAPGGFSQVAKSAVGKTGQVIALDKQPFEPLEGVVQMLGDFQDLSTQEALRLHLPETGVHWIISDMAPAFSGHVDVDVLRTIQLADEVLHFALELPVPLLGGLVVKLFHGSGSEAWLASLKKVASAVKIAKPKASRAESRECYVIAYAIIGGPPHSAEPAPAKSGG